MKMEKIQEYDIVKIKENGVVGTVVDIYSTKERKFYTVEDDARNADGGFDLYTCTEEQIEKVMNMEEMKCPCCGKRAVSEYDICDVCNWENDPVQLANPKLKGGANEMSLQEAIEAFKNGKEVK